MTRTLILLLILGAATSYYLPDTKAKFIEIATPVLEPAFRWQTKGEMNGVMKELQLYERDHYGQFMDPKRFSGWLTTQFTAEGMTDSWKMNYRLKVTNDSVFIQSNGPDLKPSTGDDIQVGQARFRPVKRGR